MERNVMWTPWSSTGLEHLRLGKQSEGIVVNGLIIGVKNNQPFRAQYEIRCDAMWQVREVSLELLSTSDRAPGDLIGKNLWEEYPGLAGNELAQIYWSAMRDRVTDSLTAFYPDHDRWYEVRTYPAPNGIAVYFRNVTDQIQTEAALRQSEARFRRIFECKMVPMGIYISTGGVAEANDALLDLIGYTRQELETEQINWQALTPPEYWSLDENALSEITNQGFSTSYEKAYIHKDGSQIPIFVGAASFLDDPNSGVFFVIDLTDRKQAETIIATDLENTRLLRDLSARLLNEDNIQVLYDEIMAAVIALTRADAGTVQILDETTQELVMLATQGFERTMTEHFYRVSAESNTSCGIALTTGERTFIDFAVPESEDPDGSLRMHVKAGYLSGQSTPLITRSGKPIGMVSTHWRNHHRPSDRELRFLDLLARQAADLIEQRQTAVEREQLLAREQAARAEADRANRIKDEFLAVLSHELRSPLNPILGWSKLLQQRKLDEAKTTIALATIERNAQLQVQLIDDLLDMSRILRGKLSLTMMSVDLSTVISAAQETVRLAAEAKGIQIRTTTPLNMGIVMGDAGRLQQVVWNLLSNAVKFTPRGGQVTIALVSDEAHAQIQVIDTGKGICSDFLPYVFEHFRQEDGATTRKFGGLGLGMAIARQIAEMHGGQIGVDSPGEGEGATFTVRIPLASRPNMILQPIEPSSRSTGDLSGIRILVVDDDADSREFVAFVLEQAGAIVTAFASGVEALQAFSQSVPNLIVSDIGMPEMDGYMLMRQIRSLPLEQGGQISAIALTAYAGELDQQQAIAAGFQRHIAKPIDPEAVVAIVTELVSSA